MAERFSFDAFVALGLLGGLNSMDNGIHHLVVEEECCCSDEDEDDYYYYYSLDERTWGDGLSHLCFHDSPSVVLVVAVAQRVGTRTDYPPSRAAAADIVVVAAAAAPGHSTPADATIQRVHLDLLHSVAAAVVVVKTVMGQNAAHHWYYYYSAGTPAEP